MVQWILSWPSPRQIPRRSSKFGYCAINHRCWASNERDCHVIYHEFEPFLDISNTIINNILHDHLAVKVFAYVGSPIIWQRGSKDMSPKQNTFGLYGCSNARQIQQKLFVKEAIEANGRLFLWYKWSCCDCTLTRT